MITDALHETGVREVLGLEIDEVESGAFWVEFLRSLRSSRLQGVRRCVSEDPRGLLAIARVLSCRWQRGTGRFRGNVPRVAERSAAEEDPIAFHAFPRRTGSSCARPIGAGQPRDWPPHRQSSRHSARVAAEPRGSRGSRNVRRGLSPPRRCPAPARCARARGRGAGRLSAFDDGGRRALSRGARTPGTEALRATRRSPCARCQAPKPEARRRRASTPEGSNPRGSLGGSPCVAHGESGDRRGRRDHRGALAR